MMTQQNLNLNLVYGENNIISKGIPYKRCPGCQQVKMLALDFYPKRTKCKECVASNRNHTELQMMRKRLHPDERCNFNAFYNK